MAGAHLFSRRQTMSKSPPPPGYDQIQHEELSNLFGRATRARLLGVPIAIAVVVWLAIARVTPWRWTLLTILALLAAVVFVHEVLRFRRRGLGRRAFAVNFAFAALGQATAALATSGIESPLFLVMFPIATASAMLVEGPMFHVIAGAQVLAIWTMVWVKLGALLPNFNPSLFGGDVLPGWNRAHVLWVAGFATAGIAAANFIGHSLRMAFDRLLRRGLEAQHEVLRSHAERARELAALSGEIAHELKNPLASIKGLAALLAEDAAPGKPSERLAVLRREVDRMQTILEEFLNFSRPLVPLSVETVELRALLVEVAEMHEGTARQRGVYITVGTGEQPVRCDPRKLKQAIINLVQNAIEASPTGAAVEMHVDGDSQVYARVLDRGPGVPAEVTDKIFDAGVTTKARGSGLGLTIARALVRQHGGDLTLAPRPGGGTIATMQLPGQHP